MSSKIKKINFGKYYDKYGLIAILLGISLIFFALKPSFFSIYNLQNIFKQVSINGLIAYGMTFVILLGAIDLSVGSILSLSAYFVGMMIVSAGIPAPIAIIAGMISGALLGLINGLLVSKMKLQPFIATLSTMTIYRGLTKVISNGLPVRELEENSALMGWLNKGEVIIFPVTMIVLILFLIISLFMLNKTIFGKHIYATGGNEEAARLSTVNTEKIKIYVYVLSGLFASIAAILYLARFNSVYPSAGEGAELDAIAAVVIGGTSMSGGRGKILGTFIGILIIGVMNNGLDLIGVSSFYQDIIKGFIILFAVVMDKSKK
ncbi:MAG: ABC transporter permease [Candidatus Izemoplasmatales bacterium]